MHKIIPDHRSSAYIQTLFDSDTLPVCQFLHATKKTRALVTYIFILVSLLAQAPVLAAEITFSGFMSIVGGQVLNGSRTTPYNDVECPCIVSDWTHLGIYNRNLSFNQESRAGVRMNAKLNESVTGVVQVDSRSVNGGKGSLEWAYISYVPAEDWTVQLGRKRIPIYYYSDFMDVGFAYPWIRPPQDLYGWEVDNFNGISIAKTGHWNDWNSRASIFYGREDSKPNIYSNFFYADQNADMVWRDLLGADLELSRDWFNIRLVYIESKVDLNLSTGPVFDGSMQRIYGLSANIDYNNWLVRSELSFFDRWDDMGYRSSAEMVGVGYHYMSFTPMLTYSQFVDDNSYGDPIWSDTGLMLSLRYDIDPNSAIKVQYDEFREISSENSTSGNANMISVSFDKIF